jgi:hypothetical protein
MPRANRYLSNPQDEDAIDIPLDLRNGEDRFMYIYNSLLRRWQINLLSQQLQMLKNVCRLLKQFIESFYPMLIGLVNMWHDDFYRCFSEEYTEPGKTCFRPATYSDITLRIGEKMAANTRIRNQQVFTVQQHYRTGLTYNALYVLQLTLPNTPIINTFGSTKIVFVSYDDCQDFPFSKFIAIFNGMIYNADGNLIGPVNNNTLQSLQTNRRFKCTKVTIIEYKLVDGDNDNDHTDDLVNTETDEDGRNNGDEDEQDNENEELCSNYTTNTSSLYTQRL